MLCCNSKAQGLLLLLVASAGHLVVGKELLLRFCCGRTSNRQRRPLVNVSSCVVLLDFPKRPGRQIGCAWLAGFEDVGAVEGPRSPRSAEYRRFCSSELDFSVHSSSNTCLPPRGCAAIDTCALWSLIWGLCYLKSRILTLCAVEAGCCGPCRACSSAPISRFNEKGSTWDDRITPCKAFKEASIGRRWRLTSGRCISSRSYTICATRHGMR